MDHKTVWVWMDVRGTCLVGCEEDEGCVSHKKRDQTLFFRCELRDRKPSCGHKEVFASPRFSLFIANPRLPKKRHDASEWPWISRRSTSQIRLRHQSRQQFNLCDSLALALISPRAEGKQSKWKVSNDNPIDYYNIYNWIRNIDTKQKLWAPINVQNVSLPYSWYSKIARKYLTHLQDQTSG